LAMSTIGKSSIASEHFIHYVPFNLG
jgi:hypothetical protein